MINPRNLQIQIKAMALMVEVEGMKAANVADVQAGGAGEYNQHAFYEFTDKLNTLAQRVDHD